MAKKSNIDNLKPFKKGEDERRNTTGANKGSRWKTTLLKDLLTVELDENEVSAFEDMKGKFPKLFDSTDEKNFQLFMELKQISLVFHKNGMIAQKAIDSIKDRIEGKPNQTLVVSNDDVKPIKTVRDV